MSSSVERFDDKAREEFSRLGQTVVHRGELLRHPLRKFRLTFHFIIARPERLPIFKPPYEVEVRNERAQIEWLRSSDPPMKRKSKRRVTK